MNDIRRTCSKCGTVITLKPNSPYAYHKKYLCGLCASHKNLPPPLTDHSIDFLSSLKDYGTRAGFYDCLEDIVDE